MPTSAEPAPSRKTSDASWPIWDRVLIGLPKVILTLELAAAVGAIILLAISSPGRELDFLPGLYTVTVLVMIANGLVAGLIISRYPRHVVGWLLLAHSSAFFLQLLAVSVRLLEANKLISSANPWVTPFLWFGHWIWTLQFMMPVMFLPLYFPTGRLLSPRWRIVAAAAAISVAAFALTSALHPGPFEAAGVDSVNPLVLTGGKAIAEALYGITRIGFLPTVLFIGIHLDGASFSPGQPGRAGPDEVADLPAHAGHALVVWHHHAVVNLGPRIRNAARALHRRLGFLLDGYRHSAGHWRRHPALPAV